MDLLQNTTGAPCRNRDTNIHLDFFTALAVVKLVENLSPVPVGATPLSLFDRRLEAVQLVGTSVFSFIINVILLAS